MSVWLALIVATECDEACFLAAHTAFSACATEQQSMYIYFAMMDDDPSSISDPSDMDAWYNELVAANGGGKNTRMLKINLLLLCCNHPRVSLSLLPLYEPTLHWIFFLCDNRIFAHCTAPFEAVQWLRPLTYIGWLHSALATYLARKKTAVVLVQNRKTWFALFL